jgi:CRP/FNR family transcriptional regulator
MATTTPTQEERRGTWPMKEDRQTSEPGSKRRSIHVREVAANVGYLTLPDLVGSEDVSTAKLVKKLARRLRFSSGQRVYPTEVTNGSLIILEGTVNIFLPYKGERTFVKRLEKGSIVGEMPFLGQRMLDTHAVAVGPCFVRVLDESAATELLLRSPELHVRLQKLSGPRHSEYLGLYVYRLRPFEWRLVRFLLEKADHDGVIRGLTHADIAEALRAPHRETVSQAMRSLRRKGWIESDKGKIKLIDRDALRKFAS